jgi:hypothetical protein
MKYFRGLILLTALTFSFPLQTKIIAFPNVVNDLSEHFKTGSSKSLAKYFGAGIEFNMNGKTAAYSPKQAEIVMREFFKKNPPLSFEIVSKGGITDQVSYFLANYQSSKHNYHILIKGINEQQSIRIFSLDIIKK